MATINFDLLPTAVTPQAITVWAKAQWLSAWVERPDLIPIQSQWNLAPQSSTATLLKKFGRVKQPGQNAFSTVTKETTRGYWVLIQYPDDSGAAPWYWLGYAESAITTKYHAARDNLPESGEQTIPCFGFLKVLEQAFITSAVHVDPADDEKLVRAKGGMVFNENEQGNRHTKKASITEDAFTSELAYGFATPDQTDAEYWSTRDIVEHLFAFHLPTKTGISGVINWSITGLNLLPNWDRPTVDTDGRNAAEILTELVTPEKLLSWGIGADAAAGNPPTINSVQVVVQTTVATPVTLPAFGTVPANSNQLDIINTTDPLTQIDVTADDSEVVDQVTVRGPKEIGIGTFVFTGQLENDWLPAEETDYGDAAKFSSGWSALDQYEKRWRNEVVRAQPNLQKVYRRLKLKKDWDGQINSKPVFVKVDDQVYVPFLANCRFKQNLPLYAGVDYSGDVDSVDESSGQDPMPPIVGLVRPGSTAVEQTSRSGQLKAGFNAFIPDAIPFSLSAAPNNDNGPKLDLLVSGAPNHAIAGSSYTGNVADAKHDLIYGGWDYQTAEVTIAIESDRRPFWTLPTDVQLGNVDVVRRKIVTIDDDALQLVHICEGTTVGFDNVGVKETSNGGILRDPTEIIQSLATVYQQFFCSPRFRMSLRSLRRPTGFSVGAIVTTVSNWGTINSVVRTISISTPLNGEGQAVVSISAASVYFDPMLLVTRRARLGSRPPEPESPGENKREKVIAQQSKKKLDRLLKDAVAKIGVNIPGN